MKELKVIKIIIPLVGIVAIGSSLYPSMIKALPKTKYSLCDYDKSKVKNDINMEYKLSSNVKGILQERNNKIEDNRAKAELNGLIKSELNNPTNTNSAVADVYDDNITIENQNSYSSPILKTLERNIDDDLNDLNDKKSEIAVDNSEEPEYEEMKTRYELESGKEVQKKYESDQKKLNLEKKLAMEKKWAEIERLYGGDMSTSAGQRDTSNDKLQSVKGYNNGGDNLNPLNVSADHILNKNIYSPTGLSAEQFNSLLEGTALSGLGQSFVDMENNWGVDGLFCMSVAFHESALGESRLAVNNNNLFGMKASSNSWKKFNSKSDCIVYFGEYMNKKLYKGKSTYEIGNIYCPPNTDHWFNCVNKYYQGFVSKLGL